MRTNARHAVMHGRWANHRAGRGRRRGRDVTVFFREQNHLAANAIVAVLAAMLGGMCEAQALQQKEQCREGGDQPAICAGARHGAHRYTIT